MHSKALKVSPGGENATQSIIKIAGLNVSLIEVR